MKTDYLRKIRFYKIVYYGAGLCGKTTNLLQLEKIVPPKNRSELISFDTEGERTIYFDNMDFNIGKTGNFDVRVRLFTVPGQTYYAATRQEVLKDVDAVVFVADSQPAVFDSNIASKTELAQYLDEMGKNLEEIPYVLQLNKRDIPGALPVEKLAAALRIKNSPVVEAVAFAGQGVMETLHQMLKLSMPIIHKKVGADKTL